MLAAMLLAPLCRNAAALPSISSFSPAFGQPGAVITINGSGFSGTTNLQFNGPAPILGDFTNISDSVILAVVPIGATTGPLSIGASVSSATFTVAPTITSFSPQTGFPPTQVYIQGANFVSGGGTNTLVTFTGAAPVNGTVTASTVVSAAVPAGAGDGPITVTTFAGSAVSTNNFLASALPTITGFSPTVAGYGTNVTINGGNFSNVASVKFNGSAASETVTSTTQISARVPAGATTGQISVTTSSGTAYSGSNFLTGSGAIITGFSPTVGTTNPPTPVTFTGLDLSAVTNVTFNGVKETITAQTPLQVSLTSASGTGPIEVFTPQGNFTTVTNFTNTTAPFVTDFSPVFAGVGANVVIDGFNFTSVNGVKFGTGSAPTSSIHVTSPTQITVAVPSSASDGSIVVSSPAGSFTTSSNFSVTTSAPYITSFTPPNGVRSTVVTINGGAFTNLSSVKFNGTTATYSPPTSTTILYAVVPALATSGTITVQNGNGTGTSSTVFYLQPWITSATASGIVNSSLAINGRNLNNAGSVQVNGVNYVFTASASQIIATVPSNAITGAITVTTPGGIYINTNSFVVLPKIYSFSPTFGPPGTIVTINGTSLFDVTSVLFNGVSTTPFNVTTNQLQAAVPTGARPGLITVVTAGGNDVSSNIFTATYASTVNLSKIANPIITGPGSNVTYTLLVTNLGPSIVTSVIVTDSIPVGFNLSSATSSVGTTVYTNNTVIATLGILTNNTSATITVKGTSPTAGAVTNSAALSFAEGDTGNYTNYAFAYVYFVTAAQRTLGIAKVGKPPEVSVTWPVSTAPFTLQVSTNLHLSNGWMSLTNGPFLSNGFNEYTNSLPSPGAEFFRLQGP